MSEPGIEQSIPDAIRRHVTTRPDAIAVISPSGSLTYAELERASNKIANGLLARLGEGAEPVAILMDQGLDNVVAILGVLKAGKFYVSLDIRDPVEKLGAQIDHSGSRIILGGRDQVRHSSGQLGQMHRWLDFGALLDGDLLQDPGVEIHPDALAYLFFTSGSTGTPKAVIDCHRNVLHNVTRYTANLEFSPGDRLSMIQMPNFSGTVSSMFGALANGAAICPFPLATEGIEALAEWMNGVGVTVFHSVPSVFRALVSTGQTFPSVRVVRLEGDRTLPGDVALFRQNFGHDCSLAVGLGATETGLSAQWILERDAPANVAGRVPVGYPTRDVEILVTDAAGTELAVGQPGEIRVRSRYLAVGYWQAPDAERAVFRPDPRDPGCRIYRTGDRGMMRPDGCLEFLGRDGDAVRVNGEWVDPGTVEAALLEIAGISQAVVLVAEGSSGTSQVTAYVVAPSDALIDTGDVRRRLAEKLSPASVPSGIVFLDAIPLTPGGKVDRRALIALSGSTPKPDPVPPADLHEEIVLGVWKEVLQRPSISVLDNYFDIGGTSLQAAAVVARLDAAFGRPVSVNDLIRHQTVRNLARHLGTGAQESSRGYLVPLRQETAHPTLSVVHEHSGSAAGYFHLARHLGKTCRTFGIQTADLDPLPKFGSIEEMAGQYLNEIKSVQQDGPYNILGFCLGGVIAFEIARQLSARGDEVGFLGIVGITPYDFPNLASREALRLWNLRSDRSLRGKIRYHLARSSGLGGGARPRYLAEKARSAWLNAWSGRFDAPLGEDHPSFPTDQKPKEMLAWLFEKYEARPFDRAVDLFLSRSSFDTYCDGSETTWSGLSSQPVTVHLADVSNDWDLLQEPEVGVTSARIGDILKGRQSRANGSAARR
jgi:amino acid adenylation domain-containing protein